MGDFEGKVAFVTGAARGQGRSHAVRLARGGADVVAVDICAQIPSVQAPMSTPEDLAETVRLVEGEGRAALPVQADVRDHIAVEAAVTAGVERFGAIDLVVANAGILPTTGEQAHTLDAWHDGIETMLSGVFYTLRETTRHMVEQEREGSVVVTSSTSGFRASAYKLDMLNPGQVAYSAAKHGVLGVTRNFAMALGPYGIRVNTVHPMAVRTPMIDNPFFKANIDDAPPGWMANVLGVGTIEPEDVSEAVLWLLSDRARYVTGVALPVDSGLLLV